MIGAGEGEMALVEEMYCSERGGTLRPLRYITPGSVKQDLPVYSALSTAGLSVPSALYW
jgi:hypothetical protein